MSWFDRMNTSAARVRMKAEESGGVAYLDTSLRKSDDNAKVIARREAMIAARWRGPNEGCDLGALAIGTRLKAEVPAAYAAQVAAIRDTHPVETSVTLDNIAAELKKLFEMLSQADKDRLLAQLANKPTFNSPTSGAGTDPMQALQEQGRVTFKSDFQIPPSLFARTTSAMRSIKKADDGVGRIDLSKLFKQQAWA